MDDEELVRKVACRLLEKLGYTVHAVSGGAEAVSFVEAASIMPDCVVIDFNMPGMNGVETLAAIRALAPDMPAILATGSYVEEVGDSESENPWNATIQKPFRLDSLSAALEEVRRANEL